MKSGIVTRIVKVKSVKDYEETPDPGETLIFREEPDNEDEIEETLQADLAMLHRIFTRSTPAAHHK